MIRNWKQKKIQKDKLITHPIKYTGHLKAANISYLKEVKEEGQLAYQLT
jgi:hypothetical protein